MTETQTTDQLVAALLRARERHTELNELIDELTAEILARHKPGDHVDYHGRPVYKVAQNRLFDKHLAVKNLTAEQLEQISTPTPDPAKARALLDEHTYETCRRDGNPHLRNA